MFVSCTSIRKTVTMGALVLLFTGMTCFSVFAATTNLTAVKGTVTTTTATISGNVSVTPDGEEILESVSERGLAYSTTSYNYTSPTRIPLTGDSYSTTITDLSPGTKYYAYSYIIYKLEGQNPRPPEYSQEIEFTTDALQITKPVVKTNLPTYSNSNNYISMSCELTSNGNDSNTKYGLLFSTSVSTPTLNTQGVTERPGVLSDQIVINSTDYGKTYYIRAYATNSAPDSPAYGEVLTVKPTAPVVNVVIPTVSTSNPAFSGSTITFNGKITSSGNGTITERGFVYSKSTTTPTISNDKVMQSTVSDTLSATLSNQPSNQTYYIRAYAINSAGPGYGETVIVTTAAPTVPAVVTNACSYSGTTVSLSGRISSTGNDIVLERGFVYSTSSTNPTTSSYTGIIRNALPSPSASPSIMNTFTDTFTGTAGKTYYIKAYVRNSKDTKYGATQTVTTGDSSDLPTVRTDSVYNVNSSTAQVEIYVSNSGGYNISQRGVIYSTSVSTPTLNESGTSYTTTTGTTGAGTVSLSGLKSSTRYYVRAYAKNSKGYVGYGTVKTLTTTATSSIAKSVEVRGIMATTATFKGEVLDTSTAVTECGVVYAKTADPTTSSPKVKSSSNSKGSFTVEIINLSIDTKYYARAYAITKNGTTYGDSIPFTTLDSAEATTSSVSSIKQTSALLNGKASNDSSKPITERGFVYSSKYSVPTVADSKVLSNSVATGSYSVAISNLAQKTTYYVRAYVKTSLGISYGNVVTFTTLAQDAVITVNMKNLNGDALKTQTITTEYGKTLSKSNLQLPVGYAMFDANWKYDVTVTAATTVIIKKIESAFMQGSGDKFYPDKAATRAEVAQVIYALSADRTVSGQAKTFPDVTSAHPAKAAIEYCSSKGYMNGFPDGTFRPNENVTRAQMSVVLCLVYNLTGTATSNFTDLKVSHWSYNYVSLATTKGMIAGYTDRSYKPDNNSTKAEVCSMFSDAEKRTLTPLGTAVFSDVPKSHWAYNKIMNAAIPK